MKAIFMGMMSAITLILMMFCLEDMQLRLGVAAIVEAIWALEWRLESVMRGGS